MVVARTFEGFSGDSVAVALVVSPFITVPGTCSVIVVIWTAAVASVTVSGVMFPFRWRHCACADFFYS